MYNNIGDIMQRLNIEDLINIDTSFVKDGCSAMYLATNPYNNKNGILKENGCMLNVTNEDVREKLASTIINICGIDTAEIELCKDKNGNNYCLSYNVLKENQTHVELENKHISETDKEEIWNKYIQNISTSIISLPQITLEEFQNIKNRILEIHFMDLIIDHYDRKTDNSKIIYDKSTKQYLPPIAYDYGASFNPNSQQKNGIFTYLSNEEVMYFLIKNHYQELSFLINNVRKTLNDNILNLILNQKEYQELNSNEIYKQIKKRLTQLDNILLGQNLENDIENKNIKNK